MRKGASLKEIHDKQAWNRIISEFPVSDTYYTWDYHKANEKKDEKSVLLLYEDSDGAIAFPLVLASIPGRPWNDAHTVYGYGGPINRASTPLTSNDHFAAALTDYFKSESVISVFARLHPFIPNQPALLQSIGEIETRGEVVYMDLSKHENAILSGYQSRHRTQTNQSKRNCRIVKEDGEGAYAKFRKIYNATMDRLKASDDYYFGDSYYKILGEARTFATDYWFAYPMDSDVIIGAGILLKKHPFAQYHLAGTSESGLLVSPTRALIDAMWRLAKKEGHTIFNLGGGLKSRRDNLFRFKSHFSKTTAPFRVWKYIADPDKYDELCSKNQFPLNTDFFPGYRISNPT